MIRSMTGYGKSTGSSSANLITIEVRSLNSKFLELGIRLPSGYKDRELELRSKVGKLAERGKVDFLVSMEPLPGSKRSLINMDTVKVYLEDIRKIQKETGLKVADPLETALRFANVVNNEKVEADPKEWKIIEKLSMDALKDFNSFRVREGKALQKDIESRTKKIDSLLKHIEKVDPGRIKNVRSRLKKNFEDSDETKSIDPNRFEQELIYYLEKMDINEEKVRLRSHLSFLLETIKSTESNGKKIGFILQEVGREINTIGSKANDAKMQRMVVEMKDELEKMKEQTANII